MIKTYRLEGDYGKLILASYDKKLLINFARTHGIRGTLKKQYEPPYILKLMRDSGKLLFSNNKNELLESL